MLCVKRYLGHYKTMSLERGIGYTYHVPAPCKEEVKVVYADDDIVLVDKPAGLLSVPGRILKDSVFQRLLYEFPDLSVVHRLDLDTSGLMVFANSRTAVTKLNRQFRERSIAKTYEALVFGRVSEYSGRIELPIGPDPHNRPLRRVDFEKGKQSLTLFELIKAGEGRSRLRLKPITGRSHQLRLHLMAIGHPILGCDLYAHPSALSASERLCLHAKSLVLEHPSSKKKVEFFSEVPF